MNEWLSGEASSSLFLFKNYLCYFNSIFTLLFEFFFFFGCVGSSFLCEGFLWLRRARATLHRGARASHHRGLSRCGAQAPDAQAQQLWLTGLVAPRHVGSSQTRARTRVPCTGRRTLNRCATREAHLLFEFLKHLFNSMKNAASITLNLYINLGKNNMFF